MSMVSTGDCCDKAMAVSFFETVSAPGYDNGVGREDPGPLGLRWALVAGVVVVSAWSLFLLDDETVMAIAGEDGGVEYAGAISWFLASGACLLAFARSSTGVDLEGTRKRGSFFLLLLGLLFLFAGGEEISWGQRLLHFEPPQAIRMTNRQGEFNVHNLPLFDARDEYGADKTGLARFLTMERLFALFWLGYCVALPIANAALPRMRGLVAREGLPIPPLLLGLAFPLNYGVHKLLEGMQKALDQPHLIWPNVEIKETIFAILFLLVALHFMQTSSMSRRLPPPGGDGK
jgi:hypothetical protein